MIHLVSSRSNNVPCYNIKSELRYELNNLAVAGEIKSVSTLLWSVLGGEQRKMNFHGVRQRVRSPEVKELNSEIEKSQEAV